MSKAIKGRIEHLDKYIQQKWDEHYLEFVLRHKDKLSWTQVSTNINITQAIIENNLDLELDWYRVSYNPNLTWDFIVKYKDKPWSWCYISRNKFLKEKNLFTEKQMRKYLAAYRIQQYWDKAITNPSCTIGRNKINRNYDELFNEDGSMRFNRDF